MIDPDEDRAGFMFLDEVVRQVSEVKGKQSMKAAAMLSLTIERDPDWRSMPMYSYSTSSGVTRASDTDRREALGKLRRIAELGYHPLREFDELPNTGYLRCDIDPLLERAGRSSPISEYLSGSPEALHAALVEALAVQRALEVRVHECNTRTMEAEKRATEWKAQADKQLFMVDKLTVRNGRQAEHLNAYKFDDEWRQGEDRRLRDLARDLDQREAAIGQFHERIAALEHALDQARQPHQDENAKSAGTKLRAIAALLSIRGRWPTSGGEFRKLLERGGVVLDDKTCRAILKGAEESRDQSGNTD